MFNIENSLSFGLRILPVTELLRVTSNLVSVGQRGSGLGIEVHV